MQSTPQTGDIAPDAMVQHIDGHHVTISNRWRESRSGLALVFLRHYGCSFCKEHAHAINDRRADFVDAGIDVLLIGCGTLEEAITFHRDLNLEISLANDHGRRAYLAYGLGRAKLASMAHPKVMTGGIRAATRGNLPGRSSGDPLQLQGQFLIDPAGIIRAADRPALMSDIPSVDRILASARSLAAA